MYQSVGFCLPSATPDCRDKPVSEKHHDIMLGTSSAFTTNLVRIICFHVSFPREVMSLKKYNIQSAHRRALFDVDNVRFANIRHHYSDSWREWCKKIAPLSTVALVASQPQSKVMATAVRPN